MEEEKETEYMLNQAYKNLEEEWDCIKLQLQSKLKTTHNSPVSPVQQRRSPSDEITTWKVRTNDLAVMEILRERRAAIESGKLKGRRLFEGFEGRNNNEDCEVRSESLTTSYDGDGSNHEGELPVASSFNCASMGMCVAQMEQREKVVVQHKRCVSRRIVLLVLLAVAVALVVFAIGITSYRDEYEVTLVPT